MSFPLAVLLRGLVVSLVGLLLVAVLRRASGATRGAVGTVVLGAMLALPLGFWAAPKRAIPVARLPFARTIRGFGLGTGFSDPPSASLAATPTVSSPEPGRPPFGAALLGTWGLGAAAIFGRLLVGGATAWGWARRSRPWTGTETHPHPPLPQGGGILLGDVRVSDEIEIPCALWAGRATILLPSSSTDWSEERLAAVLMHEAAHVRRGDWAALLLSRLVVALHWPNPVAWILARNVRRALEDAADDAVLVTGFAPADYADHLLVLAQGRSRPALALPMAHRPDLHRRIQHVLNPRKSRGSASLPSLVVASLLVGCVFVPAISLVVPQESALKANPTSFYEDVREGKTSPGTVQNGFVGHLSDGRAVQIVQVSMRTPKGIRAWKPNGEPLPGEGRRAFVLGEPHMRTILLRYPKLRSQPEGGLGSGPRSGGEPTTLVFAGGGDQAAPTADEWESFSFIGVPKEDGDHASFSFSLNDSAWTTEATIPANVGPLGDEGRLHGLEVAYPEIATPFHRDAKGHTVKDGEGRWLHDKVPSTTVAFRMDVDDAQRGIRVVAVLRSGKRIEPIWNDGKYVRQDDFQHHWFFDHAPKEIAKIEIQTRPSLNVEFLGVRLKPKG